MNMHETAKIMAYLRELYPNGREITEQTVAVWHDVLQDYEFDEIKVAARETAKTYAGYTMPPPSVVIANRKKESVRYKLYIPEPEITGEQKRLADEARERAMATLRLIGGGA